jgi:hypothetical protein
MNKTEQDLDDMVDGYMDCAVWIGLDWDNQLDGNPLPLDENYSTDDIAPKARTVIREVCAEFRDANMNDLAEIVPGQAGHDFMLTRNHHGAGFWDRGLGEVGERLTKAAHVYGESDLYVGDDGLLHLDGET